MTIVFPINGKNERLGELFNTPKHLLLYKGNSAIYTSLQYMAKRFPKAEMIILVNKRYMKAMGPFTYACTPCDDTGSQVETLRLAKVKGPVMFVDCDIVPEDINDPIGNTVYLFENKEWLKCYSNYKVNNGEVTECNEKGEYFPYAGSGIYHFSDAGEFYDRSVGCDSISEVIREYLSDSIPVYADTSSKVFRFGTLNDIKNDEGLVSRVY
jgi:hypothetical protein